VVKKRRRFRGQDAQFAVNSFENAFDFTCADDSVNFRDLLEDLIPVAFDQTAGNDQLFRRAKFLVLGHLQYGVHGLFLRRLDETAGIHDQYLCFIGARGQFIAVAREDTHHDLAIHEVLWAAQTDKTYLWHAGNCAFSRFSIVACGPYG
jgi:hypothetical protein